MSKKLVQNFTTDELKTLVDDKTSCVTVRKSIYNIQIYPYHLTDISSSIKELLNSKIAKYDQKLNGILLGYKNLKLLTPQGAIICDSCFIHIDIEGDFYIFKPEIDSLLTGIVNKKSNNHVGCLVHRLFNVSVPNNDEEDWAGHNVSIGDELILKIVYMDLDARLPYIKSQLVEIKTKKEIKEDVEDVADFKTPEESPKKKKKKRDKKNSEEGSTQEESNNESDTPSKKKKKKLKKENEQVEELETSYNDSQEDLKCNESLTKKKKKRKQEMELDNEVELETNNNDFQDELFPDESLSLPKKTQEINNKSENKKKRKSIETKKDNSTSITNVNGHHPDLSVDESLIKKKKKNKLENVEANIEVNSKKSENKKKRKSAEINAVKNNQFDEVHEKNGHDEISADFEICQPEDIDKILNCEKSPKIKKKRKSEEHTSKRESISNIHVETTFLADSEDRKSKKRKSSLVQNVIWDNKELDLHDSELEKTLGESWKPPVDESLKFNLVKIAALNESNKIKRTSTSEAELEDNIEKKKRKRKSHDGEPKPKKRKQNDVSTEKPLKKKSKSKIKT